MAADDSAVVNLSDKGITEIPKEVLLKCKEIRKLHLSKNPGIQLNNVLRHFTDVRMLSLDQCDLQDISDEICHLTQVRIAALNTSLARCASVCVPNPILTILGSGRTKDGC